jgi:Zn-dependent peptidase ImmA (M78 family)
MQLRARLALLLVLSTGVAHADVPPPQPPLELPRAEPRPARPKPARPPVTRPVETGPKLARTELDKLMAETDAIIDRVARLRGLVLKAPIARGIMTRPEIEARMKALSAEEESPEEIATMTRVAKAFGLIPPDMNLEQVVIDLLTEQVAGFYDPKAKELHLADWIGIDEQRMVMAHELTHALQDQHFDLTRYVDDDKLNSDEQLARQAVVEGDGVALMLEFELAAKLGSGQSLWADDTVVNLIASSAGQGGADSPRLAAAPRFLRETLVFPYVDGLRLIAAIRRTNGWARVDELYQRPPLSTEQVMHPARYFAGDKPVTIKAGPLRSLGKGWTRVDEDVMGEFGTRLLLAQHGLPDPRAAEAAEGWGGDRYAAYAPAPVAGAAEAPLTIVWAQVWDTETDAQEAFAAMALALPTWLGLPAQPLARDATSFRLVDAQGAVSWVTRKGPRLRIVVRAPAALEKKLAAEIWTAWK